jgi:hypothetical protein
MSHFSSLGNKANLPAASQPRPGNSTGFQIDPEFERFSASAKAGGRRIYQLPGIYRAIPLWCLAFCALGTVVVIVADVVMICAPAVTRPIAGLNETLKGMIPLFLVGVAALAILSGFLLSSPFEIAINGDHTIDFRGWTRTITLRPQDVLSIRTGSWGDPMCRGLTVRHKTGRLRLLNQFSDFHAFLDTLRSLNSAVEIKGF